MFLKALTDDEKKAFLELAYHAARADRFVTVEEFELWRAIRAELGLPMETYAVAEQPLEEAAKRFTSERSRRIALVGIVAMVMADGVRAPAEMAFLGELQRLFGMDDGTLESAFVWVERQAALVREGQALVDGDALTPATSLEGTP